LHVNNLFTNSPTQLGWQSFIFCRPKKTRLARIQGFNIGTETLTEEVLDQRPIHRGRLEVAKGDKGRCHLTEAKVLNRVGEPVLGVESLGVDLPRNFGVGHVRCCDDRLGPVPPRLVKNSLIEDVVAAKEGVGTAEASIMLKHIVAVKVVAVYQRNASAKKGFEQQVCALATSNYPGYGMGHTG
jgi:hypothetical protein